jgi:hypothetical protein
MAMGMISVGGTLKSGLNNRIAANKTPNSNLNWTIGKTVWMKFTSNVRQGGDKSTLQTIMGGAVDTKKLYDKSSRLLPTPGVVSATIKHTGTLKTLKKVEVSYKCHSLSQLQELEKLFMSLGKTVVLEYGWSRKPDGTKVSGTMADADYILGFSAFVEKASTMANTNQGVYGAAKGVVSNFSWKRASDGSFDCTTSFISPAEMMMSLDINEVTDQICCKTHRNYDEEKCSKQSDTSRLLKQILTSDVIPMGESISRHGVPVGFAMKMDKEQDDGEKEDNGWGSWLLSSVGFSSIMTPQYFITWAYFEEYIINNAIVPKSTNADTVRQSEEDKKNQALGHFRNKKIGAISRFDCGKTELYNPPMMTSADPTICMLPGQPFWDLTHVHTRNNAKGKIKDFRQMKGLKDMKPFKGRLSNLCINVRFLQKCTNESETLEELVNKVLDGINNACGNHWHLVITPLPGDPAHMTVVDAKSLGDWVSPYSIDIFGNNSICKESTLDTEVSNDIKAQLTYGSNKADDEFSLFGTGITDATPDWNNNKRETPIKCEQEDGKSMAKDDETEPKKVAAENYIDAWIDLTGGVDPETIATMKSSVKALQLAHSPEVADIQPPILPVKLSLKFDGIEGFKWGHSLSIKPLPVRYANCAFMVTGVDHDISADSWDTSISTVMRINNSSAATEATPGSFSNWSPKDD